MRILVVDDEPLARARLVKMLADIGGVEVVGEAGDGAAAMNAVDLHTPDVMLLDIRMPGVDGMEVARRLSTREDAPAIVFCTAYDQHALAAFEARAIDYLLKPVRRERLLDALERARRFNGLTHTPAATPKAQRTHLCARVRGDMKMVPVTAVAYFLADSKYVEVHYDGGAVLIEESLVGLEDEFGERFVRIHRNCLVARDRLDSLGKNADGEPTVRLRGHSEPLEVSRRNLPQVRKFIRGK